MIERAGQEKHPIAPVIYKILVSRLTNAGESEYEVLIRCLMRLMEELPSIPTQPIIETLMAREVPIQQMELELFGRMLAGEARVAVSIYNLVSKSFVEETGLGRELTLLMVQIINNFASEEILIDMTGKLIKVCLALYFANAKKMT